MVHLVSIGLGSIPFSLRWCHVTIILVGSPKNINLAYGVKDKKAWVECDIIDLEFYV